MKEKERQELKLYAINQNEERKGNYQTEMQRQRL